MCSWLRRGHKILFHVPVVTLACHTEQRSWQSLHLICTWSSDNYVGHPVNDLHTMLNRTSAEQLLGLLMWPLRHPCDPNDVLSWLPPPPSQLVPPVNWYPKWTTGWTFRHVILVMTRQDQTQNPFTTTTIRFTKITRCSSFALFAWFLRIILTKFIWFIKIH